MGLKEDKTIADIVQAVKESDAKKTKGYDTQATVTRVEDGKAWVHIPGGVPETPAELTINAQPGDNVMVRVAGGRAFLLGNATSPPTDDATAKEALSSATDALQSAVSAKLAADSAEASAATASAAAQDAVETAEAVHGIAEQAQADAETAKTNAQTAITNAAAAQAAAGAAQTSADNAQAQAASATQSADSALVGLSTVQDVVGVLNWITEHGTMTSQSGGTFDSNQVYFVQDNNGDYTVGGTRYSLVAEPKAEDINSYYVLSVDKSVQNYVATHIVVDSEGLWIIPDAGGNKVLIATGQGSTYTTAGTYLIGKVNNVDKVLAKFLTSSATVGQTDGAHSVIDADGQRFYASDGTTQLANIGYGEGASTSGTEVMPYYTFGIRRTSSVGNYSMVEGLNNDATGAYSHAEGNLTTASSSMAHAEGFGTKATGYYSHAEGSNTTASEMYSHAEGFNTTASGLASHAQNAWTKAGYAYQTVIGKCNDNQSNNAFEIGNGTSDTNRSNAFSVDWDGETRVCINKYTTSGNVDKTIYDALNTLGWLSDCVES